MPNSINFTNGEFDDFTLIDEGSSGIRLNCYLEGSITGGAGTECFHKIRGDDLVRFLAAMQVSSVVELFRIADEFDVGEWRALHRTSHQFSTEVFVWNETNWDD